MRPPWSLVEHAGFDANATNATDSKGWSNLPLRDCPPIPVIWPEPVENPECASKWRRIFGEKPTFALRVQRALSRAAHGLYRLLKKIGRYFLRH
jgi:hypothetical protein